MKTLYFVLPLLLVIIIPTAIAQEYSDNTPTPESEFERDSAPKLTMHIDSNVPQLGKDIRITGTVEGVSFPQHWRVLLDIIEPYGESLMEVRDHVRTSSINDEGEYSKSFTIRENMDFFTSSGKYKVVAHLVLERDLGTDESRTSPQDIPKGKLLAQEIFRVQPIPEPPPRIETLSGDSLELETLRNENAELKQEIVRLNGIIEELQDQVVSLVKEFAVFTINLSDWFNEQLKN